MKNLFSQLLLTALLALIGAGTATAAQQDSLVSYQLTLVKDPTTKLYGYGINHGAKPAGIGGIASIGKIFSKGDAENVDWVIPAQYEAAASRFHENLAMVTVGGKTGFIDMHNRFIIAPTFDATDEPDGFHEGLAAVKKGGKWGYIDKTGATVIDFEYDDADAFDDRYIAAVKKDGKWGAIDITGRLVVDCTNKVKAAMITVPLSNKAWRAAVAEAKEQRASGAFDARIEQLLKASTETNNRIAGDWKDELTYTGDGTDSIGKQDQYGRQFVPLTPKTDRTMADNKGKGGKDKGGKTKTTVSTTNAGPTVATVPTGKKQSYYEEQYRSYEMKAKGAYETLLDTKSTVMTTYDNEYSDTSKLLSIYQQSLRNIREAAEQSGYSIPVSQYETCSF